MAEDGAMPPKKERLSFSNRQYEMLQLDESGLLIRKFYNGMEFTDRSDADSEQLLFKDSDIVYEGFIDESKITFENPKTFQILVSINPQGEDRKFF